MEYSYVVWSHFVMYVGLFVYYNGISCLCVLVSVLDYCMPLRYGVSCCKLLGVAPLLVLVLLPHCM